MFIRFGLVTVISSELCSRYILCAVELVYYVPLRRYCNVHVGIAVSASCTCWQADNSPGFLIVSFHLTFVKITSNIGAYQLQLQLENCPRLRSEVPQTAFRTETLTLTLTSISVLDWPSIHNSYGRSPYTCKRSKWNNSLRWKLEWKAKADRRTERRRLH